MEEVLAYGCCGILLLWATIYLAWLAYASITGVVDDDAERTAILWPTMVIPVIILMVADKVSDRTKGRS